MNFRRPTSQTSTARARLAAGSPWWVSRLQTPLRRRSSTWRTRAAAEPAGASPRARGARERDGGAVLVAPLHDVGAAAEQEARDGGSVVNECAVQRREPETVRLADVGAVLDQEARDVDVAAPDRDMQHRSAVLVHVASVGAVDQRAARAVHVAAKDRDPQPPLRALMGHF